MMERYFKPSVDAPMESAEDGDYVFFTDMQTALAAKDQRVAAWQMAYEGLQRQLAEKDQELAQLKSDAHHQIDVLRRDLADAVLVKQDKQRQLDTLLGEAVWAMETIKIRAQAFLARPDVKAWQERQKEQR